MSKFRFVQLMRGLNQLALFYECSPTPAFPRWEKELERRGFVV
jgi:hypothetical protein